MDGVFYFKRDCLDNSEDEECQNCKYSEVCDKAGKVQSRKEGVS